MSIVSLAGDYLLHYLQSGKATTANMPAIPEHIRQAINDNEQRTVYSKIEAQRESLLKDECMLSITDLGAGSHKNNSQQKAIKDIATHALKPPKLAQLIHRLAAATNAGHLIELGTSLGITTAYLSAAVPNGKVTSIEGCDNIAAVARENLDKLHVTNTNVLTGNFDNLFPALVADMPSLDFVYIDGNHREQATINYFEQCLPKVHHNTLLIFDDIYWSTGMKRAWQQIKAHPQVSLTVDLFWIGLVMFPPGEVKAHYKVRV